MQPTPESRCTRGAQGVSPEGELNLRYQCRECKPPVGETLPTYNTVTNITVEDRQWAATHQTHGKPPVGEILPTHSTVTNITVEDTGSVPMELTLPVTLPRDPQGGNGELFPRLPNNDRFERWAISRNK